MFTTRYGVGHIRGADFGDGNPSDQPISAEYLPRIPSMPPFRVKGDEDLV
jgi:hypothetical protein